MYAEQPDPRINYSLTGDYTPVELFEWRNETTDPWTKEAQWVEAVEPSEDFPDGISVAWITYDDPEELPTNLLDFQVASFPRKPIKRGGSPQHP